MIIRCIRFNFLWKEEEGQICILAKYKWHCQHDSVPVGFKEDRKIIILTTNELEPIGLCYTIWMLTNMIT